MCLRHPDSGAIAATRGATNNFPPSLDHPFDQHGVFDVEIVAAADADLDGDQDLFVAYSGTPQKGGIFYFENIRDESRLCFKSGQRIYPAKKEFAAAPHTL